MLLVLTQAVIVFFLWLGACHLALAPRVMQILPRRYQWIPLLVVNLLGIVAIFYVVEYPRR
jgi:hypothetical protein